LTLRLLTGAVAVVVLLAVGCSDSPSPPREDFKAPETDRVTLSDDASRTPLLGITWDANTTWAAQGGKLVRVDPLSFRPLPGPRIELGIHGYSWSYSPDRSKLVIGGFASGLRFVDLNRFEALGDLREDRRGGLVVAVAWPKPRRVLAVVNRTVLEWRPLSISAGAVNAAAGKSGLVLLLAPLREPRRASVGPATLLFVDPRGRTRSVLLDRAWAGEESVRRGGRLVYRQWRPGLVLDPVGRRAFVVPGGGPIAEIDLRTMRVIYRELAEPISLLERLHNWLEPEAQAKGEMEGPVREARWLGDGLLAVSGFDARGEKPSKASGLKLIDTRRWTLRTLDGDAADFLATERLLIAYGCCYRTGGKPLGLTAYDRPGRTVWHLFGRRPIHAVQIAGGRAYVRLEAEWTGRRPPWVAVVDLRRGTALRRLQTPWTQLLLPHESSMAEKEG
jgi:hypothetical protein